MSQRLEIFTKNSRKILEKNFQKKNLEIFLNMKKMQKLQKNAKNVKNAKM